MQTTSKYLIAFFLVATFALSAAGGINAQANNKRKLDDIISKIRPKLPEHWIVESNEMSVVPREWPDRYKAYMIILSNPREEFKTIVKGPGGRNRTIRYNPSYKLYFVPRTGSLTPERALRDYREVMRNSMAVQAQIPALYGGGPEYILLYSESDKTGWRDGMINIANLFGITKVAIQQ